MRRIYLFGLAAILLAGCNQPPPPAPSITDTTTVSNANWQALGNVMAAKIKLGMTDSEVQQILGEPTSDETRIQMGEPTTTWRYTITSNVFFRVVFDRNHRVTGYKTSSTFPSG